MDLILGLARTFSSSDQFPTISSADATNAGFYYVKVTVDGCTSDSTATNVVVNGMPSTPAPASNSAVCEGDVLWNL